jgi:predicted phosphodiesterase
MNLDELEKQILEDIMKDGSIGRRTIMNKYNIGEGQARKIVKECKQILEKDEYTSVDDAYEDLLDYSSLLEKQKQRLRDQQRIERKVRNRIRVENALEDYTKELINIFKDREVNYTIPKHKIVNEEVVGVFQISDTHFNEIIDINGNKYDFKIASKRLQKYVCMAKRQFKNHGIEKVIIAMTGDLLNSDRRLDELLNMSTNRAKASALSAMLLEQVIVDLAQDFSITLTYVTGNESRVGEYFGSTEIMVSDNYDTTIFEMLRMMFKDKPIDFIDGSVGEKVIKVCDKHILMLHGQQMNSNISKQSQQIKGKYSDKNIKIDYIIFGHIHECLIADFYARSSSLCGANAYSDYSLQLTSRASQNIHFVSKDGINTMKVDLQEYDDYEGYDIDETLEAYNAKSSSKGKEEKFILVNVL